jgi:hypothetical protein
VVKNDIEKTLEKIKAEMQAENLDVRILRKVEPSMEDVFIYQAQNSESSHE